MITFTIFVGFDNVEEIIVVEEGTVQTDLSGVTKVQVIISGVVIDSSTAPADTVWWTDQKTVTQAMADADETGVLAGYVGDVVDVLKLRLGNVDTLTAGKYKNCCLILFDAVNTDGIVWDSKMTLTVKSGCS